MNILTKITAKLRAVLFYPHCFKHFGRKSVIFAPLQIDGRKNIEIGNNVTVQCGAWLASVPLTGNTQPLLHLSDGCQIGHFNHIYATDRIVFEKDVLTADGVYVTDNLHSYEDVGLPVLKQQIQAVSSVTIGEGSWIGEHACIIGASVGKHCVVGANAVVTHYIPDYSVAVGVPARVIKKYNHSTKQWEKV